MKASYQEILSHTQTNAQHFGEKAFHINQYIPVEAHSLQCDVAPINNAIWLINEGQGYLYLWTKSAAVHAAVTAASPVSSRVCFKKGISIVPPVPASCCFSFVLVCCPLVDAVAKFRV